MRYWGIYLVENFHIIHEVWSRFVAILVYQLISFSYFELEFWLGLVSDTFI